MVALHNHRLSDKDLFRGVLWTDAQWHAKANGYREELKSHGFVEPKLTFAVSAAMENYQQQQPSLKQRQEIMRRLKTFTKSGIATLRLDLEEISYLRDRLEGVNDPVGQRILKKISEPDRG